MILGCDVVGEVVQIGSEVPADQVQIGELRWTFINGGMSEERGGFAEYVFADLYCSKNDL